MAASRITAAVRASAVARMGYLFLFFDEMMDEEEPGRRLQRLTLTPPPLKRILAEEKKEALC